MMDLSLDSRTVSSSYDISMIISQEKRESLTLRIHVDAGIVVITIVKPYPYCKMIKHNTEVIMMIGLLHYD